MLKNLSAAGLIFILNVPMVFAANYQSPESLITVAREFLLQSIPVEPEETLKVSVNPPDAKLKLAACDVSIKTDFSEGSNKVHASGVELSCAAPKPWKIALPVSVSIMANVLVAKHNISSHQTINEDDVDLAVVDKTHLYSGSFKNKDEVLGLVTGQTIVAGMVLNKHNLQQPIIVHRNEVIDLIARNNAVSVSMKGLARSDGGLHDMIKAYNPSSKRTLDAVVISQGKVEVIS